MTPDLAPFVGRTYGPGEFTVERWLAHLWADATQNENDSFRPGDDGVKYAPPTLAQIIAREAAGTGEIERELREDDWDALSVFLGGQRLSFEGSLRVGETYRATARVTGVEAKEGSAGRFQLLTIAYAVETAAGEPVFDLETDLVVRGDG